MRFLENDLEEIIHNYALNNKEALKERGLNIEGKIFRQLKIGNYGISDLITIKRSYGEEYDLQSFNEELCEYSYYKYDTHFLDITIYELKRDKIGISALLQCARYANGIKDYLSSSKFSQDFKINLVLLGNEIDKSGSFCYLANIFDNLKFITYKYEIDGIKFEDGGNYVLTNNGFKS